MSVAMTPSRIDPLWDEAFEESEAAVSGGARWGDPERAPAGPPTPRRSLYERLRPVVGIVDDLPSDAASRVDEHLYDARED